MFKLNNMELTVVNIAVFVLIPILTAVLGGWVGAYYGNKYRENKETHEKEIVRNIAIKALNILKSYSRKSFREAEGEFNKSMSLIGDANLPRICEAMKFLSSTRWN